MDDYIEEEQEKKKGLARELAEEVAKEKIKEMAKKAIAEPVKKAVKAGAKKAVLAVGKALIASFPTWGPIVGIIILSILVIVVIFYVLIEGGLDVCLELAQLKVNDPVTYEQIKNEYINKNEDIETICAEAFKKVPGPAAEVYQAKTPQEEIRTTLESGF